MQKVRHHVVFETQCILQMACHQDISGYEQNEQKSFRSSTINKSHTAPEKTVKEACLMTRKLQQPDRWAVKTLGDYLKLSTLSQSFCCS